MQIQTRVEMKLCGLSNSRGNHRCTQSGCAGYVKFLVCIGECVFIKRGFARCVLGNFIYRFIAIFISVSRPVAAKCTQPIVALNEPPPVVVDVGRA